MSQTTIEWTQRPGTIGETWNPTTGCNKVDRGCKNCYAEIMHKRLQAMGQPKYKEDFLSGASVQVDTLDIPRRWTKPRTVFVNSMSDLFHKLVPFAFLDMVFQVMQETPQHTYLILTKRPEIALQYWKACKIRVNGWSCPPNVWMGTSAHDHASACARVPLLLQLDGCLRFLSYEPAIGSLNLRRLVLESSALDEEGKEKQTVYNNALQGVLSKHITRGEAEIYREVITRDYPRLHWVICGGESGPKAEPMHPQWARQVRDDCRKAGVPFFFKQHGAWAPVNYRTLNQELYIKFNLGKNEFLFEDPLQNMVKLGKHKTGHLLDGESWQQFPE